MKDHPDWVQLVLVPYMEGPDYGVTDMSLSYHLPAADLKAGRFDRLESTFGQHFDLPMKTKTKIVDVGLGGVGIVAGCLLAFFARPGQDAGSQASDAVAALSDCEAAHLFRVTDSVFRMSPGPAYLCSANPTQLPPHVNYYCHVFVNDIARAPMQSGQGDYVVGSIVVKQKYSDRFARNTELFTIMRKMEPGYDPENGDWEYSIVEPDASSPVSNGRTKSCIACHAAYKDTDYISRVYLASSAN